MASAADIVSFAQQQLGKPYVFGAVGPGSFDCQGLVRFVFGHFGIQMQGGSTNQWLQGPQVNNPSPGDLVFFNEAGGTPPLAAHVGILTDNGQTMIDAPHTGADVRYDPIQGFGEVTGFTRPLGGPGGPGGAAPPGGNSAGNQVQTFFNDDPSPVDGGDMVGLTDPHNNRPLLWDRAKSPFITNLLHGSMKTIAPPHFAVYFMFNPQSVDYSYGFNATAIPIAYEDNSLQNNAQVLMNQTITFSLLFDRIYEVGYWDWTVKHNGAAPNLSFGVGDIWDSPTGPHTDGVNWDIRAIERLIGIYDKTLTVPPTGTDPNNPGASPKPGQLISNAGVPMGNAVDVALGSRAAPVFRGYVGGLGVNYTRFNEKMVPVRAEVQVTLIRLPVPNPGKIDVPAGYNPYVTTPTVY